MFGPQVREFVVTQGGENADDVLPIPADGRLGQPVRGDFTQPQVDVGGQGDRLGGLLSGAITTGTLKEH